MNKLLSFQAFRGHVPKPVKIRKLTEEAPELIKIKTPDNAFYTLTVEGSFMINPWFKGDGNCWLS